jgi:hypothetical protein
VNCVLLDEHLPRGTGEASRFSAGSKIRRLPAVAVNELIIWPRLSAIEDQMQRYSPSDLTAPEVGRMTGPDLGKAPNVARRRLVGRVGLIVVALTSATAGTLSPFGDASASSTAQSQKKKSVTAEIALIDQYNTWFLGGAYAGDMGKLKAGLPKYITNETVLHEPVSLPWGGTFIGYEGWVRLCQITDPIFEKLSSLLEFSAPRYYQHRNVVFNETTMTIKSTKVAPEPFTMGIVEKYTIESDRIKQIDEYYADTASLIDRLSVLGIFPEHKR